MGQKGADLVVLSGCVGFNLLQIMNGRVGEYDGGVAVFLCLILIFVTVNIFYIVIIWYICSEID